LRWTFDASRSKSKSRNTPFDGLAMRGAAVATVVAGRVLYRHPELDRIRAGKQGEVTLK
jgi:dihydroorotase